MSCDVESAGTKKQDCEHCVVVALWFGMCTQVFMF